MKLFNIIKYLSSIYLLGLSLSFASSPPCKQLNVDRPPRVVLDYNNASTDPSKPVDVSKSVSLLPGEYAIVGKNDPNGKLYINAMGRADPAVLISLYDKMSGVIGLVYIDLHSHPIESLKMFLSIFRGMGIFSPEVRVFINSGTNPSTATELGEIMVDALNRVGLKPQEVTHESLVMIGLDGEIYDISLLSPPIENGSFTGKRLGHFLMRANNLLFRAYP